MEEPNINIAIASNKPLLIGCIKFAIEPYKNVLISIEASTSQTLFDLLENAAVKPDICIIDVEIADLQRDNLVSRIKYSWPEIPILAIAIRSDESTVRVVLQKEISGYLSLNLSETQVYNALLAVYENRHFKFHVMPDELWHINESLSTQN